MSNDTENYIAGSKSFINIKKIRFWLAIATILGFSLIMGLMNLFNFIFNRG